MRFWKLRVARELGTAATIKREHGFTCNKHELGPTSLFLCVQTWGLRPVAWLHAALKSPIEDASSLASTARSGDCSDLCVTSSVLEDSSFERLFRGGTRLSATCPHCPTPPVPLPALFRLHRTFGLHEHDCLQQPRTRHAEAAPKETYHIRRTPRHTAAGHVKRPSPVRHPFFRARRAAGAHRAGGGAPAVVPSKRAPTSRWWGWCCRHEERQPTQRR